MKTRERNDDVSIKKLIPPVKKTLQIAESDEAKSGCMTCFFEKKESFYGPRNSEKQRYFPNICSISSQRTCLYFETRIKRTKLFNHNKT